MALNDFMQQLAHIEMFRLLGPEALRLIAFSAESRILQAGDVLFREGEAADAGIVVLSGGFTLTRSGVPDEIAQRVRPGALIGEMALLSQSFRPATAVASEISGILRVPRTLFLRVLQEYPDCAVRLHADIAQRTAQTTASLAQFRQRFLLD